MIELNYGDELQEGDKVKVGKKYRIVYKINRDRKVAYVRMNMMCTLELPLIYNEEFKSTDEYDEYTYEVYRE